MDNIKKEKREASFGYALFVIIAFLVILVGGTLLLDAPVSAMFLISWLFLVPAIMHLGYSFSEVWEAMISSIKEGTYAIVILLAIGALIGSWILAGTVPAVLYWGMNVISPQYFMFTAFLICVIFSLACGTSWGTMGTIGIALYGVGVALGVSEGAVVGVIVSGAYFGDMLSPLSDSPNIITGVVRVNLMEYIKKFVIVVIPAFVVTCIIFFVMGLTGHIDGSVGNSVIEIQGAISEHFKVGFLAFIPLIVTIVLLLIKVDSLMTIIISAVVGLIIAPIYQGVAVTDLVNVFWNGFVIESGNEMLDSLLNRGGALSMSDTSWMMLLAFGLVGACERANVMTVLVRPIKNKVKTFWQLTGVAQITSLIGNCMGVNNFSLLMSGTILRPVYEEKGVDPVNLAIAVNGTGTVMNSLIPWNAGAIYVLGLYGVSIIDWAPYSIFSWAMPVCIFVFALFNKSFRITPKEKTAADVGEAEISDAEKEL